MYHVILLVIVLMILLLILLEENGIEKGLWKTLAVLLLMVK